TAVASFGCLHQAQHPADTTIEQTTKFGIAHRGVLIAGVTVGTQETIVNPEALGEGLVRHLKWLPHPRPRRPTKKLTCRGGWRAVELGEGVMPPRSGAAPGSSKPLARQDAPRGSV